MSTPIQPTVLITLEVARVGKGGNTAGGRYFYNFDPDIVNVGKTDTRVVYQLTEDSRQYFRIRQFFSTDARNQFSEPRIDDAGHRVEVVNRNTATYLILVSILVEDVRDGTLVNCDPQVTNVPET